MTRDPEVREAAERITAEWARSIDTLPLARTSDAVKFTLNLLADPASDGTQLLDLICRKRWPGRECLWLEGIRPRGGEREPC